MSLRPMLFASRIKPLLAAAESGDVSLVPKIVEWFRANLDKPDPATLDMAKREAEQLLSGKIMGQAESEEQVHIISTMATILGIQDNTAMIADGEWKQVAWDEYFRGARDFLDPSTITLFGQLAQCKRPLFGASIETSWSYYGYLVNEEVRKFLSGLDSASATHPEIASMDFIDGFHGELTGWLRETQKRATDLWLFAW